MDRGEGQAMRRAVAAGVGGLAGGGGGGEGMDGGEGRAMRRAVAAGLGALAGCGGGGAAGPPAGGAAPGPLAAGDVAVVAPLYGADETVWVGLGGDPFGGLPIGTR